MAALLAWSRIRRPARQRQMLGGTPRRIAMRDPTPRYTARLQSVECGRVSREGERGWKAHLTTDEDEPAEAVVYCRAAQRKNSETGIRGGISPSSPKCVTAGRVVSSSDIVI